MCHHCTNRGHWEVSFISILRLLVGFVLLDESILSRNVKFWSSICKLFPGTCLFNLSSLSSTFPLQDSIEQWFCLPKKPADIFRCNKTTSEEGVQKFHIDDMSLPRFRKYFCLFKTNFPHGTANQKHNLDR